MKILFNEKEVLELTETQKKVIQNDIPKDIFEADMARRCKYILESPCEKFVHQKKNDMKSELAEMGEKSIPADAIALGARFAERCACPVGYEDIVSPDICTVGNLSFEFSPQHRKIWRKMKAPMQDVLSKEDYISHEREDLANSLKMILEHKYERCFARLELEWVPKLIERGISEFPIDRDEFAELVFSQPDYKNRSERDAEINQ